MSLHIRNISKTYPNGVQALKNVSLTIPAGMYGLLGPNGAGKSTLMRILATLQEPDAGSIELRSSSEFLGSSSEFLGSPISGSSESVDFLATTPRNPRNPRNQGTEELGAKELGANELDGAGVIDVVRQKDPVRETLGYLPQEFGVYPKISAEKLLDHFAILKGIIDRRARKEVVEALLRQTNLWEVRKQNLGGYSGGMRQRFGVAVALIGNPKLMIVDEPTAGLDPAERVRFLNLLSELGENSVVILSTHIVEDVSELCTRMAIIDRGQILLEAEPLRAVEELKGQIWRRVIERGALAEVEREHNVISTKLLSGRTVVHVHADASPGAGFEPVEPDLEDVYFTTMGGHHHPVPRSSSEFLGFSETKAHALRDSQGRSPEEPEEPEEPRNSDESDSEEPSRGGHE